MYPRAKTLGILLYDEQILVEEFHGKHSKGEGTYYRPIGGTIEFGEKSTDALVREYHGRIKCRSHNKTIHWLFGKHIQN